MAPLVQISNVPAIMYSNNTTSHATGGITHAATIKTSHPRCGDATARDLLRHTMQVTNRMPYFLEFPRNIYSHQKIFVQFAAMANGLNIKWQSKQKSDIKSLIKKGL